MTNKTSVGSGPSVMGVAVLGERGQLVIPKEARDSLKLKTGDRFIVVAGNGHGLMLIPAKQIQMMMKHMSSNFRKAASLLSLDV